MVIHPLCAAQPAAALTIAQRAQCARQLANFGSRYDGNFAAFAAFGALAGQTRLQRAHELLEPRLRSEFHS